MAALAAGELAYVADGTTHRFAVGEGFAEVSEDHVRVLVEEAQRAEEVDATAAAKDVVEGQQKLLALKEGDPEYDLERAKVERAAARVTVARR